jgi:methyl-accepting chemotaxis protein
MAKSSKKLTSKRTTRSSSNKSTARSTSTRSSRKRIHAGVDDATFFHQIVEHTSCATIIADLKGRITYMNPASVSMLEKIESHLPWPTKAMVGQNVDMFYRAAGQSVGDDDAPELNGSRGSNESRIRLGPETLAMKVSELSSPDGTQIGILLNLDRITEAIETTRRDRVTRQNQQEIQDNFEDGINRLLEVVAGAAEGDLTRTATLSEERHGQLNRLADGIRIMIADLRDLITQITESSDQQNEGAHAIAENAANLSNTAQHQANNVEVVINSVRKLTSSIDKIASAASDARMQAEETTLLAKNGGDTVRRAIEAMRLIQISSQLLPVFPNYIC